MAMQTSLMSMASTIASDHRYRIATPKLGTQNKLPARARPRRQRVQPSQPSPQTSPSDLQAESQASKSIRTTASSQQPRGIHGLGSRSISAQAFCRPLIQSPPIQTPALATKTFFQS